MNVIIIYKWGYDPDDAYIAPNGSFKWKRGQLVASDDDAAAIESAKKLADATQGNLIGVTIGNGDASWAAARGAQHIFYNEDFMPFSDDVSTAVDLVSVVKAAGSTDVVVMGNAIESAGVAPALAAMLGIPCVANVRDFAIDPDDPSRIIAHREAGDFQETIRFKTPVLIAVSAEKEEKNVPSMKEMLTARKVPSEKVVHDASNKDGLTIYSLGKAELKRARLFDGDPDHAASDLVAALREIRIL